MNVHYRVVAGLMVCVAARPSRAAPLAINLSTGLDATGTVQSAGGLADANWLVAAQPARVVAPGSSDWWGLWPANDVNSSWIVKDPTSNSTNGVGTYSRAFDLSGIDPGTVSLTGRWAVDDEGTLALNGHQIGAYQPHDAWKNFATQTFSVTDPTWFNAGPNLLTLTIAQSDNFFEGVRLQSTLVAATPEPASLAVVAIAAAALAGRRRHR